MVARMPEVGRQLLAPLPKIEDVVALVEHQGPPWGVPGEPDPQRPAGAAVLRACIDATDHLPGRSLRRGLESMEARSGCYPGAVLTALANHPPAGGRRVARSTRWSWCPA